jgi:hypothetical protein
MTASIAAASSKPTADQQDNDLQNTVEDIKRLDGMEREARQRFSPCSTHHYANAAELES